MSTIVLVVQASGTADQEDRRAMDLEISKENARRATLSPPGTPLPNSTATERRQSYEAIFTPKVQAAHQNNINESNVATLEDLRTAWAAATDQQRNAALAALTG